jgi:phage replication O-like protein O
MEGIFVLTDYQFPGFDGPSYTQTPDILYDEMLRPGYLSEAELRVLLYIIRRTFGWKKTSDTISLTQLSEGIIRKDGTRLDYGAGVGRKAASAASKSLEAKGIIRAQRHERTPGVSNETTTYTLVMRGANPGIPKTPGEYPKDTSPGILDALPLVSQSYPQETPVQETVIQEDIPTGNEPEPPADEPPLTVELCNLGKQIHDPAWAVAQLRCEAVVRSGMPVRVLMERLRAAPGATIMARLRTLGLLSPQPD